MYEVVSGVIRKVIARTFAANRVSLGLVSFDFVNCVGFEFHPL